VTVAISKAHPVCFYSPQTKPAGSSCDCACMLL